MIKCKDCKCGYLDRSWGANSHGLLKNVTPLMSLNFCCEIQMVGSEFGVNNMTQEPSCLVSTVQAGGAGIVVWGIFSWHTSGPSVPAEHHLNSTAYVLLLTMSISLFIIYPSWEGYFQQDNTPCHKTQIISNCFLKYDNELISTNGFHSHQIFKMLWNERFASCVCSRCNAIMTIWNRISEEYFQHLVESM